MTLSDAKLGMTKEVMATKVLPFLFPLSIENGLTVTQVRSLL
jgi:SCY1-like protein 2